MDKMPNLCHLRMRNRNPCNRNPYNSNLCNHSPQIRNLSRVRVIATSVAHMSDRVNAFVIIAEPA